MAVQKRTLLAFELGFDPASTTCEFRCQSEPRFRINFEPLDTAKHEGGERLSKVTGWLNASSEITALLAPVDDEIAASGRNDARTRCLRGHIALCTAGQAKYLNNIVEQDHRALKRVTDPMMGFKSFWSAQKLIAGSRPCTW